VTKRVVDDPRLSRFQDELAKWIDNPVCDVPTTALFGRSVASEFGLITDLDLFNSSELLVARKDDFDRIFLVSTFVMALTTVGLRYEIAWNDAVLSRWSNLQVANLRSFVASWPDFVHRSWESIANKLLCFPDYYNHQAGDDKGKKVVCELTRPDSCDVEDEDCRNQALRRRGLLAASAEPHSTVQEGKNPSLVKRGTPRPFVVTCNKPSGSVSRTVYSFAYIDQAKLEDNDPRQGWF
jgi:hypothetical protein